MSVSLARQLACAKRELAYRTKLYPRWIGSDKLSQEEARDELDAMQAIVHTLERLHAEAQGQLRLTFDRTD